jgi:flagellar hook-associated protein 2
VADATFRASGLASGLDTNSIVDQLTKLEAIPIDRLKSRQAAFNTQITSLGDLSAKVESLKGAANKLAKNGGLGVKQTTTNEAFVATPGTAAIAGQYDIEITDLATNARARTLGNTKDAAIKSGTLGISVSGTNYDITINDGDSLATVAASIKRSGAAVTATVLNNGTQDYLSIVRKESGFTVGTAPEDALVITANQTGGTGEDLAFTETDPKNAKFKVNDLDFERTSNTVSDVVPGTTLLLKKEDTGRESLQLENDTSQTVTNLAGFVDSYNRLSKAISDNLRPSAKSDRQYSLAGDSSLRSLQKTLQGMLTSVVGGLGDVRTLADLGVKTDQQEGTISIDTTKLQKSLDADPLALNAIFSTTTSGVSALVDEVARRYTNSFDGVLTTRRKGISSQVKGMDRQIESLNIRLSGYKQNLLDQFAAMEKTVSGLKTTGDFLSRQNR